MKSREAVKRKDGKGGGQGREKREGREKYRERGKTQHPMKNKMSDRKGGR